MLACRSLQSRVPRVFFVSWLALASAASADPVLDQQTSAAFPTIPPGSIGVVNVQCCLWAQTFTFGISGQLTTIDVLLPFPDIQYDIQLRETVGGIPSPAEESVVAVLSAMPQDFGTFQRFDLTPLGFFGSAGNVLSLSLRSQELGSWVMFGNDVPGTVPYTRGAAFERLSTAHPWTPIVGTTWDFSLRTFVDPAAPPVPEPTTIVLVGVGVLAIGRNAWKRRRSGAQG